MTETGEHNQTLQSDIETRGWHVVLAAGEQHDPAYGYTVGLYKTFRHPELIIIGLGLPLIHSLLNSMGEEILKGQVYIPGEAFGDVLDDYNCFMLPVAAAQYERYMGEANNYYRHKDYPALQCIYPNRDSVYPWQASWPEALNAVQPLLGDAKIYR